MRKPRRFRRNPINACSCCGFIKKRKFNIHYVRKKTQSSEQIRLLPYAERICPECGNTFKLRRCYWCNKPFICNIIQIYCCRICKTRAINKKNTDLVIENSWGYRRTKCTSKKMPKEADW